MNFFFGIKTSLINSKISIPKFQNFGKIDNTLRVFEAYPENNKWKINNVYCQENKDFFFISDQIENNKIFFLSNTDEVKKYKKNFYEELIKLNFFTDTSPAFRSNLKISLINGGYSSYQSEYPYEMSRKKGNILSPISMLLNRDADQNIIYFKNIFYKPIVEKSSMYFINYKLRKIIDKIDIKYNYLNEINIKKDLINNDIYIFTEECLGIPLFVSIKNFQISFEHTHPPHHYILSEDRYKQISKIKNDFKDIIKK